MILINGYNNFADPGDIRYAFDPYYHDPLRGYFLKNPEVLSQGAGAAIKWVGNNGSLINSAFYYNHYDASTSYDGKVISWLGENGTISNTKFDFNSFTFYSTINMVFPSFPNSKVIDSTIHGDYIGSLYGSLNIVDVKVNTMPDLKNSTYSFY